MKIVVNGRCCICSKELTNSLFLCEECKAKQEASVMEQKNKESRKQYEEKNNSYS